MKSYIQKVNWFSFACQKFSARLRFMSTGAPDGTAWQTFTDIINRLVGPDSINLRSSGTQIERMCIGFAQGSETQRLNTADGFTAGYLVSLLPDLLHLCAIKPTFDANHNRVVGFESVKETSVLTLTRHFLDSMAFFDIDKYALSFLTNLLLVLDKHNSGEGVAAVHRNRFYTSLGQTAFEKIIRVRFYMLMQPRDSPDIDNMKKEIEQLNSGLGQTDPYARKQIYLSLLEMIKADNSNEKRKFITDILGDKLSLDTEMDLFAQAALVRLVPYMEPNPDKEKLTQLWGKLNFQSRLALVLECTELQNVNKAIAKAVAKLAREPFSLRNTKGHFTSKLLTRLASKIQVLAEDDRPAQQIRGNPWDVTQDLEDDKKPYTTRVALFRQNVPMPVGTLEDFGKQMRLLRSPVYLIRMEAANHVSEFAKRILHDASSLLDELSLFDTSLGKFVSEQPVVRMFMNPPKNPKRKVRAEEKEQDEIKAVIAEVQNRIDSINVTGNGGNPITLVINKVSKQIHVFLQGFESIPVLTKKRARELKAWADSLKEIVQKGLPQDLGTQDCRYCAFQELKRIITSEYEIGNAGTRQAILMLLSQMAEVKTDSHGKKKNALSLCWSETCDHMRRAMQGNSEGMAETTEILPTSPLGQYWMSFEVRHASLWDGK